MTASDQKARAMMVAQSQLAELRVEGLSPDRPTAGSDASGLTWRIKVDSMDSADDVLPIVLEVLPPEPSRGPPLLTVRTILFVGMRHND